MARTVTLPHPLAQAAGPLSLDGTAVGAVLLLLRPFARAALAASDALVDAGVAWAENRRARIEDSKLRELALSDSRIAADLVALQQSGR
jgi:hypothetical protein